MGYLAACTQPKWPNQFGSLEFWWSVYISSTSVFLVIFVSNLTPILNWIMDSIKSEK